VKNTHIAGLTAHLPKTVRSLTWTRNHHYLRIAYADGHEEQLDATKVLVGQCTVCDETNTVASRKTGRMPPKIFCSYCGADLETKQPERRLAFLPAHVFDQRSKS
jgi:hypothetical protein